ncbi:Protein Aatf [Gryllus bimaculatus]|nr:Protein Aatf [Gryllus bimaculatus]
MSSKRKSTLDQIAEFLQPAPEIGSDDEFDFDTRAKVIEEFEDEFSGDEKLHRPILKQSAALDDDPRYTGKKISRRDVGVAEDSEIESSEEPEPVLLQHPESSDSEDFKSAGEEVEDNKDESNEEELGGDSDENSDMEDYESADNDEYSIMNSKNTEAMEEDDDEEEGDETFQHVSSAKNVESEIEKGKAVRNQLNLWDNLLECRIHLQKCLIPANRFPKHYKIEQFKQEGGQQFASEMKKTTRNVRKLLDKLVDLQETLIKNYSETKKLGQKTKKGKSVSDEEIPSDSDVDGEGGGDDDDGDDESLKAEPSKKKRRHCEDYEDVLNSVHKQYLEFRDATIQKWNDRTRLITGKASSRDFSAFEQSTLQQIRHVLSNRTRLLQRTRVPRTVGQILGEPEPSENLQPDHDPEIFDDSDFYHQLLRELIERRSDDSTDANTLGRRWAALQKLRTKMKRKVDTRATKGRRLRYDPHQKLVGFMAPVESSTMWNDKAVNELYNSLFGKKV